MAYQETDPLLPRNRPAPEIQGSRPQSINEVGNEDAISPDTEITSKPRMGLGDIYALLLGLIALAFFAVLIFPNGFKEVLGDGPQTIDERVNSILSRTPLIGILSSRDYWPSKADRTIRWPQ
jgi:membrane dipeptidase